MKMVPLEKVRSSNGDLFSWLDTNTFNRKSFIFLKLKQKF
jgi:hypothetical protein